MEIEIRERWPFFPGLDQALFSPWFSWFLGFASKTVQRSELCRSRRELSNEYLLAKIESTKSPLFFWRAKAGKLERRWRERTCTVSGPRAIPENPADAQDDAVQADVDAELKIAFEDIRSFFPSAPPGNRAQHSRAE